MNRTSTVILPGARTRLALWLLPPALLWLLGLIVLRVELAVLSLRTRVAPRVYAFGRSYQRSSMSRLLAHIVRTAAMSVLPPRARC
jgi:hypothetical protein